MTGPPPPSGQQPYGPQPPPYGDPSPYGGPPLPAAYPPGGPRIAGMRDRLLARVIDWLLMGMLALTLVAPGIAFMVASGDGTGTPSGAATGVFLAGLLVAVPLVLLYEPYLIRRRGATVGKKAMKLTVRMEATGALPTAKAAWFRFGVPVVAALAPLGSVLVYVSPFFDSSGRRQGWHDRVAGTVVVKG